jgi:hypothetical protein
MPKHNIYQRINPENGTVGSRRLEVHWQRDGDIALNSTVWAGLGDPNPDLEFLPAQEPPRAAWRGEAIILEREQINHLIRQLRIARDQAFGKDE